ncbi:MAG: carboxypeptidase regulatory-like domain-containing protein [Planctomycetes bacterium]|nr:carboxypeptidase regulatory-like domain-containing protein [Planctomycetota bacterium]
MTRRGTSLLWLAAGLIVVGAGVFYGLRLTEAPSRDGAPIELDAPEPKAPGKRMDITPTGPRAEPSPAEKPAGATVTGRLVNRDLVPVPDAEIELREGNTLGMAGMMHLPRLGNHRATSDALGFFAFTEVPPTSELVVHAEGAFATRDAGPYVVGAGELVDLGDVVVEPGMLVHGTVQGPDAERVRRARVALHDVFVRNVGADLPDPLRVVLTDDDGRYELPNVPHMIFNLVIDADGYAGKVVEQPTVPDRALPQLVFDVTLEKSVPLSGTVVEAATGRPLRDVEISAQPAGLGLPPGVTRSDDEGAFTFSNLIPGRYNIWCDAKGYGRKGQIVTADDWADGVALQLYRAASISGLVLDPDDRPVANFDLLARRSSNKTVTGSPIGSFERFRGADGAFEVTDLEAGWYSFEVWAKGYAVTRSDPVRLKRGENLTGITITMQPGAALVGRLVDDLGEPIAGARVSLHPNHLPEVEFLRGGEPDAVWMKAVNSARDGTFSMPDVTENVYQVEFAHSSYPIVRRNDVAVEAGVRTSLGDVVIPRPGTLRGQVVDRSGVPVADATVFVDGEGCNRSVRSNGQGDYVVDRLAPGRYTVRANPATPNLADIQAMVQAELQRVTQEHLTGVEERVEIGAGETREYLVRLD